MLTVAETEIFSRYVSDYWSEEERGEFAAWIAEHYDAGDVVRGSGGCRKVRWARKGTGKSGGVRVISQHVCGRNNLAVADLCKERARKHPRPYIESCEG